MNITVILDCILLLTTIIGMFMFVFGGVVFLISNSGTSKAKTSAAITLIGAAVYVLSLLTHYYLINFNSL